MRPRRIIGLILHIYVMRCIICFNITKLITGKSDIRLGLNMLRLRVACDMQAKYHATFSRSVLSTLKEVTQMGGHLAVFVASSVGSRIAAVSIDAVPPRVNVMNSATPAAMLSLFLIYE